ncbi:hypothetical protein HBI56_012760 [Parastagonospora nodorum]|uniref:Uncharacterized protein n=1 Tax=Phaeosphaeria nodorum (strain SN15 / ATCC MYA-4574 / FGSC 10173) TaxID=321614 RepID=A0A7U2ET19_PHANO|nr:hypothetical protein HBH56_008840 [Parastagonospora nodorum]QRC90620.1 hypothetical protein JI435_001440 [Parastagonospora nodorum SN15]KAH3922198.1 hypothetical protein HBH54_226960 [Parastagonospora nodorum]KAH3939380.1 hypothetical protein HBH53_236360 [Parastagonospora nodorum]KAH3987018.1 hypothetical protein HBH51_014450 [Parastagonospora nodorum]
MDDLAAEIAKVKLQSIQVHQLCLDKAGVAARLVELRSEPIVPLLLNQILAVLVHLLSASKASMLAGASAKKPFRFMTPEQDTRQFSDRDLAREWIPGLAEQFPLPRPSTETPGTPVPKKGEEDE